MNRLSNFAARLLGDTGVVFYLSVLIVAGFVAAAAIAPGTVEQISQQILDVTAKNVGWLYLFVTTGFVLFTIFLALSKFGAVRFGPDDEPAEFSLTSWIGMI